MGSEMNEHQASNNANNIKMDGYQAPSDVENIKVFDVNTLF